MVDFKSLFTKFNEIIGCNVPLVIYQIELFGIERELIVPVLFCHL